MKKESERLSQEVNQSDTNKLGKCELIDKILPSWIFP